MASALVRGSFRDAVAVKTRHGFDAGLCHLLHRDARQDNFSPRGATPPESFGYRGNSPSTIDDFYRPPAATISPACDIAQSLMPSCAANLIAGPDACEGPCCESMMRICSAARA